MMATFADWNSGKICSRMKTKIPRTAVITRTPPILIKPVMNRSTNKVTGWVKKRLGLLAYDGKPMEIFYKLASEKPAPNL